MVSVQTGDGVERPSIRPIVALEARSPMGVDESEERLSIPGHNGWLGRYRSAASFLVVLTFAFLALVFILAHGKIADPDIWWHLHNADYLIHHHSLPNSDTYSFTVPGHPWMNHEWLAELPYYFAWRAFGLSGIDAVAVILISLIFLGALYLSYRECGNYKAAVLASSYAVFIGTVSFGPRTILFGYACLVGLLIILQRFRQKGQAALWLIPPLFCLWVNLHGSWFIGMIIFTIMVAIGMVRLNWGMIDSEPWTEKLAVGLGCECGRSVRQPFWCAPRVLPARPRLSPESQH